MWFSAGKHNLLGFTNSEQALLNGTIPTVDAAAAPTFAEQVWPLAMRDLSYFIESDHVIVPSINDTAGLRFYADSPRIFVWSVSPDPSGKSGTVYMESDLRRDSLRGIAKDPSSAAAAVAQHKLWFGALEGAMEHELGAPPGFDPNSHFESTSSLADSGSVVVLGPGNAPANASDPETQARLQNALANGDTLVVPKGVLAGGDSGWWQISHGTGDMRAVLNEDLDGAGGFTPGGYGRGPIRVTLPGGGGGPKSYWLPEPEDYPWEKPPSKGAGGGEIGEYATLTQIAVSVAPLVKELAILTTAVLTWAYVAFSIADMTGP